MLQHKHFAKLRPHRHTSYAGLFFALIVAGILLLGFSMAADAAPPAVNPQSGSIGLTGTVRGPAPKTAAVILTPRNGSRTSSIPITVSGTCPEGTFVSITKNGAFGGVTPCQDDGTFSILVDLFDGTNSLVAKVTDALGQSGPDSPTVTVYYDAPSFSIPGGIGKQLFLQTDTTVVAGDPGAAIKRSVNIVGGVGPYAVSFDWGDSSTSLVSQNDEGPVTGTHTYDRPGTYRVVIRVTDNLGNTAYLQVVTIVNGPAEPLGSTSGNGFGQISGVLLAAWPLFVLATMMVIFFWLGERREYGKLKRKHLVLG